MTSDRLGDTYVTALRHGLVDLPDETTLVGVVRRPPAGFDSAVDENRPSLGPPPSLLDEFERRYEDLKIQGLCDEGAHNAAWEELGFEQRYRSHLTESSDARRALSALTDRLRAGERLVLVCRENTDQKRCHRTLLRDRIVARL